jgi:hypothetical protein
MKFILNKKRYLLDLILEDKKHALKILKDNRVSKSDADFNRLIELLNTSFKSLNLLGMLTKFLIVDKIPIFQLDGLIRWLDENKGSRLLSKPLMQYKRFELLKDEITIIDTKRKVKLSVDLLPREQKDYYENSTKEERDIFNGWSVKLHEIKFKTPYTSKLSKLRSMGGMIAYLEEFVKKNIVIKTFDEMITEIENTSGANLVSVDTDNGIIVAEISNYKASNTLGSISWCISTGLGAWSEYVYDKKAYQYFIWNYSLSEADPLHQIGATVLVSNKISDIHDVNDHCLKDEIPQFILNLNLKGISMEEYEERMKYVIEERRSNSKNEFDSNRDTMLVAEALQKYLDSVGTWQDSSDIYDIHIGSDHNYQMTFLKYLEEEFLVGTDADATASYFEWGKGLIDDQGIIGGINENIWRNTIDIEAVVDFYTPDEENQAWNYPEDCGIEKELTELGKSTLAELKVKLKEAEDAYEASDEENEELYDLQSELFDKVEELEDGESDDDDLFGYTDEAIETHIEGFKEQIREDVWYFLEMYGVLTEDKENSNYYNRNRKLYKMQEHHEEAFYDVDTVIQYMLDQYPTARTVLGRKNEEEYHINHNGVDYVIFEYEE